MGDEGSIRTHWRALPPEIAQLILDQSRDRLLSDPDAMRTFLQQLESARRPADHRFASLIERSKVAPDSAARLLDRWILAAQAGSKMVELPGAELTDFDRRMMKLCATLAELPFAEHNCPAATVLTLDQRVLALGVNRAFWPLPEWNRHGEMEALSALRQRLALAAANVLLCHRDRGGALPDDAGALLTALEDAGARFGPAEWIDHPEQLAKSGAFDPALIAAHARTLMIFAHEGGFMRDARGRLHPLYRDLLQRALSAGWLSAADLAPWSSMERVYLREPGLRITLYTSLEPCGMCMQNCTLEGQIGRLIFGAADPFAGAVKVVEHYPEFFFDQELVPFEIIGGVEAEKPAAMFQQFFDLEYHPRDG